MKKIKSSFSGVLFGIILLIAGTVLLWWNEGNNVKNIGMVNYAKESAVEVSSTSIDSKNDGKLIATTGDVILGEAEIIDDTFGVHAKNILLKRIVEVYQWKQEEHTDSNDNVTYEYKKVWSSDLIDSSRFHNTGYKNPTSVSYNSKVFVYDDVKVGDYVLTDEQKRSLPLNKDYQISNLDIILPNGYHMINNYITNADLDKPEIGDIRISYKYNDYTNISVLAGQKGNQFVKFTAPNGGTIYRFENGTMNKAELIKSFETDNNIMKWVLRIIGIVLIFIGYLLISGPISTLSSFVPILGNIVGFAVGAVSFVVALAHGFIVIAIAWIRFRPMLAFGLIGGAIAIFVLIIIILTTKKNKNNSQIN